MHFTMTDAQADTVGKLVTKGYKITKFHADGVIDMVTHINGVTVRVWAKPDGTCRPPRTEETMIASSELHELGIVVKSAKD